MRDVTIADAARFLGRLLVLVVLLALSALAGHSPWFWIYVVGLIGAWVLIPLTRANDEFGHFKQTLREWDGR